MSNKAINRTKPHVIFYRRPFLAFGYCRCLCLFVCVSVCVCGNHMLVVKITHHLFELGSPNLDHRCKRPWLRSLLILGGDWPWPSRSNLTSKSIITPFWACPCNNSSPLQARITKFEPELQNALVKIPIVLRVNWAWLVKFYYFQQEIAANCEKYIRAKDTQVSLMIFSSEFKLVKPFVFLSFIFESTDRYNVFHMTHT